MKNNRKNRRARKGLTLIELLVTVLILGILAAVAIPLYTSSISNAKEKAAGQNRQVILNAVQVRKSQNPSDTYSGIATAVTADMVAALPDLGNKVVPPDGCGSYTFSGTATKFTVTDGCGSDSIGS